MKQGMMPKTIERITNNMTRIGENNIQSFFDIIIDFSDDEKVALHDKKGCFISFLPVFTTLGSAYLLSKIICTPCLFHYE